MDRGKPRKTLIGVEAEDRNVTVEFSLYLKENTTLYNYKDLLVNAV
jgi:hypothetical protein